MLAAQIGMLIAGSLAIHVDQSQNVTRSDQQAIVRGLADAVRAQTGFPGVIDSAAPTGRSLWLPC